MADTADTEAILQAIQGMENKLRAELVDVRDSLAGQIGEVASIARTAQNDAKEALQLATKHDNQINVSNPPPPPAPGLPSPPPLIRRITGAEDSLTDVIGQLSNIRSDMVTKDAVAKLATKDEVATKEEVKEIAAAVARVESLNVKQNKTMGLADDAATLGAKLYAFIMSRDGAVFAARLGMFAAIVYGAFMMQRAVQELQARQPQPHADPPALTTGSPP